MSIDTDELTIERLQDGVRHHARDEYLRVLRTSNIEGLDDAGLSLGGDVSALHWMAAEDNRPHRTASSFSMATGLNSAKCT